MRINKYLASAGVASRRGADDIIKHGRVKVNGKIVTQLGMDITEKDFVEVDNNPIIGAEEKVYIALNKPKGYITTMRDQFNRPCVMELVSEVPARVFPVGRLDRDTEGGMGVCVGRLREDSVYDYKFVGLAHNTLRGAAGGAVLEAETLVALGYITHK